MAKLDSIKEKVNVAEDFARKIWLAGLGAYGKGYDEAKGRFEELNTDAAKVFDELVGKGEKLEAEAKKTFQQKTEELKGKADLNISERVAEVRQKLGLNATDNEDKIDELSAKIDALTDIVEKLTNK
jgi:polyhydroxyalkanoate synthesis regulator phasin